jgi:hypothetical protein
VTRTHKPMRTVKSLWLASWPSWVLVVFAALAATRWLPEGYARAAVAAPILLMAPGSLTLGAVFSACSRPRGASFVCYAALLSVIWTVFASLALNVLGMLIAVGSTFVCLLAVSAALTAVAQARLLFERPGRGRRAAPKPETVDPDLSEAETGSAKTREAAKGSAYYGFAAVIAGAALLAGGLYAYERLPHPAPTGYTWMAWSGPRISGPVAIGSTGADLRFQITHHQQGTTTFRLSAMWLGSPPRTLAKPLTVRIGPDKTFQGMLFVPPLPDGCTYRIVVALATAPQIDPLIKHSQTWSINADVYNPTKSTKTCK